MDCRTFLKTAVAALSLLAFDAQATLIDNGDGTVTDDVSNKMWIKDFNLAASNTFGLAYSTDLGDHPSDSYAASYAEQIFTSGYMNWGAALHWIDAMNTANYLGFNDWRLPGVTDTGSSGCNFAYTGTDCGYNVDLATGELADLWYRALGNTPLYDNSGSGPQAGWGLTNAGPFDNMQSYAYWSGTAYAPGTNRAWLFYTNYCYQRYTYKDRGLYAVAVRSCDAGGCEGTVPVPGTLALLGLGLAGGAVRRRR